MEVAPKQKEAMVIASKLADTPGVWADAAFGLQYALVKSEGVLSKKATEAAFKLSSAGLEMMPQVESMFQVRCKG